MTEQKRLTEQEIFHELSEIDKDENLSEQEKETSRNIYKAELQRLRYDKYIAVQKDTIEKLRIKIIDRCEELYPKLYLVGKDGIINNIEFDIAQVSNIDVFYKLTNKDIVGSMGEIANDTLSGSIDVYLDDTLHQDLVKLNNLYREYIHSINRKYINLEAQLVGIIDSEIFEIDTRKNGELVYREQSEYDALFVKENKKINEMNIYPKEKGLLREIIIDATKYGKSNGCLYNPADLTEYVNQKQEARISKVM